MRANPAQLVAEDPNTLALLSLHERLEYIGSRLTPSVKLLPYRQVCNNTKSVRLMEQDPVRRSIIIFNFSVADIYVHTQEIVLQEATDWVRIRADGFWEPLACPTNDIWVIGTVASPTIQNVIAYAGV